MRVLTADKLVFLWVEKHRNAAIACMPLRHRLALALVGQVGNAFRKSMLSEPWANSSNEYSGRMTIRVDC